MFLKHKLPLEPGGDLVRVAGEHLGRAAAVVEADERLGDDEAALRELRAVGGERHRRLELRDVVVGEVADDRRVERLRLLEGDEPRAGADEGVAPEPALLDGLEQEARRRALAQAEVGAERGQQVGRDAHGRATVAAALDSPQCPSPRPSTRSFGRTARRGTSSSRTTRSATRSSGVAEIETDSVGNLIARRRGDGPLLALFAHLDVIGARRRAHRRRRPDRRAPARQLARERRLRPARRDPDEGRRRPRRDRAQGEGQREGRVGAALRRHRRARTATEARSLVETGRPDGARRAAARAGERAAGVADAGQPRRRLRRARDAAARRGRERRRRRRPPRRSSARTARMAAAHGLRPAVAIAIDVTYATDVPARRPGDRRPPHARRRRRDLPRAGRQSTRVRAPRRGGARGGDRPHDRGRREDVHRRGRHLRLPRGDPDGPRLDPAPEHALADRDRPARATSRRASAC